MRRSVNYNAPTPTVRGLTGGCAGVGRGCGVGFGEQFQVLARWRGVSRFRVWGAASSPAVFDASAVPILPTKNPPPPRHLAPLPHALSPAVVLLHALAGGFVLVAEMVVLRVVPTGAYRRLPFAFFFLCCLDAFLDGARGLAAVIAWRSAALGVGGQGGREEGDGEEGVGEVRGVEGH